MTSPLEDIAAVLTPNPDVEYKGPEGFADTKPAQPVPGKRPRGRPRKDGTPVGSPRVTPGDGTSNRASVTKTEVPMPKPGVIAEGVSGIYGFAAMALMGPRPQTATALMANAAEIGKAWEVAAENNPAIRKMLMTMMQTSTIGVLVAVHIPVVMVAAEESKQIKAKKAAEKEEADGGTTVSQPVRTAPANS